MAPILKHSHYTPARGGHAPGDLREAFGNAALAFIDWNDGEPEPTVELREQQIPISKVFGLLWNCDDIMPGTLFGWINDDLDAGLERRTYSAAARYLKGRMDG